eukprot:gene7079-175_t
MSGLRWFHVYATAPFLLCCIPVSLLVPPQGLCWFPVYAMTPCILCCISISLLVPPKLNVSCRGSDGSMCTPPPPSSCAAAPSLNWCPLSVMPGLRWSHVYATAPFLVCCISISLLVSPQGPLTGVTGVAGPYQARRHFE